MTGQGGVLPGPDPSWTAAELLAHAEASVALSAAWLPALAALDPTCLDPDARLSLALLLQRMTAVTDALALQALAAVPDRRCRPDPALAETHPEAAARVCPGGTRCHHHWQVDELAALSGLPAWLMTRRYGWAWELTHAWAPLAALLTGGQITTEHLRRFERATSGADPEATAAAVTAACELIGTDAHIGVDSFARTARAAALRHTTPDEAVKRRRETAREASGVLFTALDDGLASLDVTGDSHKLEALRALLHDHPAITMPGKGDLRTKGQRQVDLLISLCLGGAGLARHPFADPTSAERAPGQPFGPTGWSGGPGETDGPGAGNRAAASWPLDTARASEPTVGVIITASQETLTGLSNEPGLLGDTPTSAALIRAWVSDPVWAQRAVTDDHGHIRTLGARQRFPGARLRATVQTRWQRCTYPGCPMPARNSQLDHAEPHALGGTTELLNLHPLCPRHHRLKEQPGVHVRLQPDGTADWTLPSGRHLQVPAPDHRPRPGPHDGLNEVGRGWGPPDLEGAPYDDPLDTATAWDYDTWVENLVGQDPHVDAA